MARPSGDDQSEFRSEPIVTDDIARLDEVEFEPIDPRYLKVQMIGCAIAATIVVIAAVVAGFFVPVLLAVGGGALALLVVTLVAVLAPVEIRRMGYAVRSQDFSFRQGVISQSTSTVPYARVQHVNVGRGPIERHFGLARLELSTAGGSITVAGLGHETAEKLKELVSLRAAELAEAETVSDVVDTTTVAAPSRVVDAGPAHGARAVASDVDVVTTDGGVEGAHDG